MLGLERMRPRPQLCHLVHRLVALQRRLAHFRLLVSQRPHVLACEQVQLLGVRVAQRVDRRLCVEQLCMVRGGQALGAREPLLDSVQL
jgi:hypothetical protein